MHPNSSDSSTSQNYQLYETLDVGESPVSLKQMKSELGLGANSCGLDDFLKTTIAACTAWGQGYTGREFTDNTYSLLIDCFEDRISIRYSPIETIDSVKHFVSGALVTVDAATYYLKRGAYLSEILLLGSAAWPTDTDDREQAIEIEFTTVAISDDKLSIAISAIKRHVTYMFENRGDCEDCGGCADKAGAKPLYNMIRIPRI